MEILFNCKESNIGFTDFTWKVTNTVAQSDIKTFDF